MQIIVNRIVREAALQNATVCSRTSRYFWHTAFWDVLNIVWAHSSVSLGLFDYQTIAQHLHSRYCGCRRKRMFNFSLLVVSQCLDEFQIKEFLSSSLMSSFRQRLVESSG